MTFVSKVLVVVQLVLSVCFMAFAGAVVAVQTNWKQTSEQLEEDLKVSRTAVSNLQEEKSTLEQEMTAQLKQTTTDLNNWKAKATGLEDQLQATTNQLEIVKTERDNQQALAQVAGEEAKMRRVEAQLQRSVNSELHEKLDQLGTEAQQLKDAKFSLERKIEAISLLYDEKLERLAIVEAVARENGLEIPKDARVLEGKTPPPPDVQGLVLNVRKGKKRGTEFVEVSLGADDQLLEGHSLFVFRTAANNNGRAKFLGKIEIVLLAPDRAVGTVVEKAKNGVIQRGDHVTTRL